MFCRTSFPMASLGVTPEERLLPGKILLKVSKFFPRFAPDGEEQRISALPCL
jgi:hypothetical protein